MLPKKETLKLLIKSNTSFLIYGQTSSGKTTLVQELLEETKAKYIEINCTLANKRANFLRLFNVELNKFLRKENIHFEKLNSPLSIDAWLNQIKKLTFERDEIVQKLDGTYIFLDNIQQMVISQAFLPAFYTACQKEFGFRFSFIFCGINFLKKQYTLELPFRTMISFCMPKPLRLFSEIINQGVKDKLKSTFRDSTQDQRDRTATLLGKQIIAFFENIDVNLQRIRYITHAITEAIVKHLDPREIGKSMNKFINSNGGQMKKIMRTVSEAGPILDDVLKRKLNMIDNEEHCEGIMNLQFYPNLILTSIHCADYYPEKEDRRRFHDYKGKANHRNKDIKKSDFKIGRHNIQRIIAISQALQSQMTKPHKEKVLQHHSLDFYAQFEHLKKMGRIKITGTKCTGVIREEECKAFMTKNNLLYGQFNEDN